MWSNDFASFLPRNITAEPQRSQRNKKIRHSGEGGTGESRTYYSDRIDRMDRIFFAFPDERQKESSLSNNPPSFRRRPESPPPVIPRLGRGIQYSQNKLRLILLYGKDIHMIIS
jgi:hypothetical protein